MLRFVSATVGLFAVLFVLGGAGPTSAQAPDTSSATEPSTYGWMGSHMGASGSGGTAAHFGPVNHVRPPHLYRNELFAAIGEQGPLSGSGHGGVAAMYGRTTKWLLGRASVATGLSVGSANRAYEEDSRFVVGLPVKATVHLTPPHYAVVGREVIAFAHLNAVWSFAEVSLGLTVGRLR